MLPSASGPAALTARISHCYSMAEEQRDVFESHRHHVFSVAYYMTGDEREAETILETSFIEAFAQKTRPSIDDLDRALMRELHQRLSFTPVEPAVPATQTSETLAGKNVRRTDLEEALWQLPTLERICFLLRDVEGYQPSRVAELLNASESEVQRTLLSARIRMRNLLIQAHSKNRAEA
jgi:RNA polymerase sigma-70 factor (ECF subfamily)